MILSLPVSTNHPLIGTSGRRRPAPDLTFGDERFAADADTGATANASL
ncbi:hypothetical protein U2F26_28035 [Micromonospora sp. 4G57]|uniref:Uncharacterized protein n=1 Tax=Micromonospora sicca TaxID=2202420 RepID=A0ABU5JPE4_9ACTN|nr:MULTISPECIES: hypothetical protein [unclassified Micromonospora]MDZ5446529.1 hypothetical protein [Micromonospora sp. 4G57]MDZ5494238.1 hypothetical protein [Micromonospora sp. 4G53]